MSHSVSINGHALHEMEMLLEPYSNDVVAHLRYPKHQVRYVVEGETLRVNLPAFLAIELYRTAVLPQDPTDPVAVRIGGRPVGRFVVQDFRYPNSTGDSRRVTITFHRAIGRAGTDKPIE